MPFDGLIVISNFSFCLPLSFSTLTCVLTHLCVSVLLARIASLQQELAGIEWTEKHASDAGILDLEDAFAQLLTTRSSPALQGKGKG